MGQASSASADSVTCGSGHDSSLGPGASQTSMLGCEISRESGTSISGAATDRQLTVGRRTAEIYYINQICRVTTSYKPSQNNVKND